MDFSWATEYPEVHKICMLFQLAELRNPLKYKYRPLQAFIQNGPQCGLVALAMVIGKEPIQQTVQLVFETAKQYNYTYNGEMFSANHMEKLAKKFLSDCDVRLYCGNLYTEEIMSSLLNGAQIIVPYDTNKDNSPGCFEGHKAHWCAISGAIQTSQDFFVIARHGKVKNVAIWRLKDLAESNAQLHEFSPDRKLQDVEYKLPEGGIAASMGLNNKSVIIK